MEKGPDCADGIIVCTTLNTDEGKRRELSEEISGKKRITKHGQCKCYKTISKLDVLVIKVTGII